MHFRDAEEPSIQLEWFRKVQNLVQDGFDTDQVAHGVLDARLRVEVEDAFTRDFLQLGADRGERLTHFRGQEHAEFADRGLPLLFPDNGFRGAWGRYVSGGAGRSSAGAWLIGRRAGA